MTNPITLSLLLLSTSVVTNCKAEATSFLETLHSETQQMVDYFFSPHRHLQSTYDPNEMADFSSVTLDDMLDKIMEASGFDPATGCFLQQQQQPLMNPNNNNGPQPHQPFDNVNYNNNNPNHNNGHHRRRLNQESTVIDDPDQLKGLESLTVNDLLDMITGERNHRDPPVVRIIAFREQMGVYNPNRRQRCGRQHRGHHGHKNQNANPNQNQPQQRMRGGSGRKVKAPHQRMQGGSHPRPQQQQQGVSPRQSRPHQRAGNGQGSPPQQQQPQPKVGNIRAQQTFGGGGGHPRPKGGNGNGGHPRPHGGNNNQGHH